MDGGSLKLFKGFLFYEIMLKSYKYRIYPNKKQQELISKFFGCTRFIYNLGLEAKNIAWGSDRKKISCFDLIRQITDLKKDCTWLKESPNQSLQMSLINLEKAYINFFKGKGFPKFKDKNSKQSCQFIKNVSVSIDTGIIKLPKLKQVKCIFDREFVGTIKTTTLSKTTTGKYFVSILVENQDQIPEKKPVIETTTVGIDLGIKTLAVLSDGTEIPNPRWFRKAQKNLKRQQRSLARKKKGSKRRDKQRLVVAKVHEKIKNQRNDYLHKTTTEIIRNYDTIVVEDLNVSGMMKNRKLSKAIGEIGWSEFRKQLSYKSEWYGKNLLVIGRFEPSSKICSCCGKINKELKLSDRKWSCFSCGIIHDRDKNAAINIKNFGLRKQPSTVNAI